MVAGHNARFDLQAKRNAIGYMILLQALRWRCVECVIHYERDVREEKQHMHVARTTNNRVTSSGDLYCCLLPQCEALRTCRSGFPIATILVAFLLELFYSSLFIAILFQILRTKSLCNACVATINISWS